jgi:hypothetical protein
VRGSNAFSAPQIELQDGRCMSKQSIWGLIIVALVAFWSGVVYLMGFWYD